MELPVTALKKVLRFLPGSVLPLVPNPLLFSDFFIQAYSHTTGVVVPVQALDGLFLLMTQHGLEYPNFYKQLYRLMTPNLLHVKYKTRFFQLLDKCLCRNEMLPAHVVAAFLKRLVRCTMTNAPPASILFVLALVSNLLQKHPTVASLIHQDNNKMMVVDPFDAETNDPEQANALQSSLWELGALERHYHHAVSTLAKSLGRDLAATPLYNLDDFLVHSYPSLFEQERKKRRKAQTTPLAFVEPVSLFGDNDVFCNILAIPREVVDNL